MIDHEFNAINTLLLVVTLGLCILLAYQIKQHSFYYLPESAAATIDLNDYIDYSLMYNDLGIIYLSRFQYEEARQAFIRSVYENQYYLPGIVNLASIYQKLGNNEVAEALFEYTSTLPDLPAEYYHNYATFW